MHCGLQAEQQVGQAGFSSTRHVVLSIAAVLPQVRLARSSQGVAHLVVLSDELLPSGQRLATLDTKTISTTLEDRPHSSLQATY